MRIKAPQFDLAGVEDCFNLRGELLREHVAKQHVPEDATGDLFADYGEISKGRAVLRGELAVQS